MRLPSRRAPAPRAASAEPSTWLVAAEPGTRAGRRDRRAASARRSCASATSTGRTAAGAGVRRRAARRRRAAYAEPNAALRRASALDATPGGYARGFVVAPGLAPPAPGTGRDRRHRRPRRPLASRPRGEHAPAQPRPGARTARHDGRLGRRRRVQRRRRRRDLPLGARPVDRAAAGDHLRRRGERHRRRRPRRREDHQPQLRLARRLRVALRHASRSRTLGQPRRRGGRQRVRARATR